MNPQVFVVGNMVPVIPDEQVTCAICGAQFQTNCRGAIYTSEACEFVCDACGQREVPGLMPLVLALRQDVEYTVTTDGARFDLDAAAWTCPACSREWETSPSDNWHIVDVARGRPVCEECQRGERFQALVLLRERLIAADVAEAL
jgi:hypothetical protein